MKSKLILILATATFLLTSISLFGQTLSLRWARHVSGSGQELGSAVGIDNNENVFVVGSFRDTIEVNTTSGLTKLISKGKEDMFILKANPAGDVLWCKHIGGKGSLGGGSINIDPFNRAFFSIAIDQSDDIYITGEFKDTVDFDPGPGKDIRHTVYYELNTGDPELGGFIKDNYENTFLLKLNNDGDFQWVRTFAGKPNSAYCISIDNKDKSIFIAGRFQDTIDVNERKGTDLLISNKHFDILHKPEYDGFIAKFNISGAFLWAKQIRGNGALGNETYGIHADQNGFLYATGQYTDSADFNFGSSAALLRSLNPATKGPNIFVAKYDIKGNYIWAKGMGSLTNNRSTRGSAITTDIRNNVLLTGFYQGIGIFDPNNFNNPNAQVSNIYRGSTPANAGVSCFVAKLDSSGSFIWAKGLNGSYVDHGTAIATDDEGSVYTTGYFGGTANFNPNHTPAKNLVANYEPNVINGFISKLDSNGDYSWARSIHGGYSRAQDIIVSPGRNVYVTGFFSKKADFNHNQGTPVEVLSKGNWDAYVIKLSCLDTNGITLSIEICANEYELNAKIYEESGVYTQRFRNTSGCDSIVTLDLLLNKIPKAIINVDEFELSTTAVYNTYQWYLNNSIIPGATSRYYTVLENGAYKVVVSTDAACVDTSDIYKVTNIVGIKNQILLANQIKTYPNPAKNTLFINAPEKVNATIIELEGKIIKEIKNATQISLSELTEGIYLIRISDENGNLIKVEKLIKLK